MPVCQDCQRSVLSPTEFESRTSGVDPCTMEATAGETLDGCKCQISCCLQLPSDLLGPRPACRAHFATTSCATMRPPPQVSSQVPHGVDWADPVLGRLLERHAAKSVGIIQQHCLPSPSDTGTSKIPKRCTWSAVA